MSARWSPIATKLLAKLKPLAIISVGTRQRAPPTHYWGRIDAKKKYGPLPNVHISYEDGLRLLESEAKRVRLVLEGEEKEAMSQNVIGELEGSLRPEDIALIGGHYDTVSDVSGASDNAAGTALVMELARVFKEKGTKRTMRFIAWSCEELGTRGSRYYSRKLSEESEKLKKEKPDEYVETELDRIKLAINLDVHGAFFGTNAAPCPRTTESNGFRQAPLQRDGSSLRC